MITFDRPQPPKFMLQTTQEIFHPAPELDEFVQLHFLNPESPLYNIDHDHLRTATIRYLWTNVYNEKAGRRIVGTCELPTVQGSKWVKARHDYQMYQWFGPVNIDALITLDVHYINECDDINFLSTADHELYHAIHKMNKYGELLFDDETGNPKIGIGGHDVEEHLGIMRRYGPGACAGQTAEFIALASRTPEIGFATIASMCGNCVR